MSEFNFKSSVCTSREQSERLLALGLKKETADMWRGFLVGGETLVPTEDVDLYNFYVEPIPAWSLGRLIEMMPRSVCKDNIHYERTLFPDSVSYYKELYIDCGDDLMSFDSPNLYDRVIHMCEWLIKEGYFNKEYLV